MKLKPFREVIAMSKEKLDEALAPIRAKQVKMQAELKMAELDEQVVSLEAQTQELCAQKQIDFERLLGLMDKADLIERRRKQYRKVLEELFPE